MLTSTVFRRTFDNHTSEEEATDVGGMKQQRKCDNARPDLFYRCRLTQAGFGMDSTGDVSVSAAAPGRAIGLGGQQNTYSSGPVERSVEDYTEGGNEHGQNNFHTSGDRPRHETCGGKL